MSETKLTEKEKFAQLRKVFEPYFNSIGETDAVFVAKMQYPFSAPGNDKKEQVISFWERDFLKSGYQNGKDFYIEIVDGNNNRLSNELVLYRYPHNPRWNDESEGLEKAIYGGYTKYILPVYELQEVYRGIEGEPLVTKEAPRTTQSQLDIFGEDGNLDAHLTEFTMRDLISVIYRKPMSSKIWLNSLINNLNEGVEI